MSLKEVDVTLFSPACSPGVLDNPVVSVTENGILVAITNNQDTVVEVLAAWEIEDTSGVKLPFNSISSNGEWSVVDQDNGHFSLVLRDHGPVADGSTNVLAVKFALGVNTEVWVAGFSVDTVVLDDVVEGVWLQTTIASFVAALFAVVFHAVVAAVNQVLFRQANQCVASEEPLRFDVTGGTERPAGTAVSLVLDWGDGVLIAPIEGGWEGSDGLRRWVASHDRPVWIDGW